MRLPSAAAVERAAIAAIALLLVAPVVVTEDGRGGGRVGLPAIYGRGTDEENYLVYLHSLVRDGDLDLKNNHAQVLLGGPDAGRQARGKLVPHHSTYWIDGRLYNWSQLVDRARSRWLRTEDGLPYLAFHPWIPEEVANGPEYSAHLVGGPLIAAAFLWPLRWTPELLEPGAVLLSALAVALAAFLLWRLTFLFSSQPVVRVVVVAAAFLATPAWFYARTFFNEPLLVACAVLAVWALLCRKSEWGAGLALALVTSMKPPLILLGGALAIPALLRRDLWALVRLGAPALVVTAGLLALNHWMFGSPLRTPQPYGFGWHLPKALPVLLWAKDRGLLWFAPVLLVGLAGLWPLWRARAAEARVVAAAAGVLIVPFLFWQDYGGGWCYGPRLLVPSFPFAALGLAGAFEAGWLRAFPARFVFFNALLYSIAANGQAVFAYWVTMTYGVPWKIFLDLLRSLGP